MRLPDRLRRLLSSGGPDDEASIREEFGAPDRGEAELRRDRYDYTGGEAVDAAEAALEELKAPPDPAP